MQTLDLNLHWIAFHKQRHWRFQPSKKNIKILSLPQTPKLEICHCFHAQHESGWVQEERSQFGSFSSGALLTASKAWNKQQWGTSLFTHWSDFENPEKKSVCIYGEVGSERMHFIALHSNGEVGYLSNTANAAELRHLFLEFVTCNNHGQGSVFFTWNLRICRP